MGLRSWLLGRKQSPLDEAADKLRAYYRKHRHPMMVIEQIVRQIPAGQHPVLRRKLARIGENAKWAAPEAMQSHWVDLMTTLQEELGETDTPWKQRIATIMSDGKTPPR